MPRHHCLRRPALSSRHLCAPTLHFWIRSVISGIIIDQRPSSSFPRHSVSGAHRPSPPITLFNVLPVVSRFFCTVLIVYPAHCIPSTISVLVYVPKYRTAPIHHYMSSHPSAPSITSVISHASACQRSLSFAAFNVAPKPVISRPPILHYSTTSQ